MDRGAPLGGPVIWFFYLVSAIAIVGSLYQLVDLARRSDDGYGRWGRGVWLPIPILMVFGLLGALIGGPLGFTPVLTPAYGGFLFAAMVASLVQLPAYLLRVVFPKSEPPTEQGGDV